MDSLQISDKPFVLSRKVWLQVFCRGNVLTCKKKQNKTRHDKTWHDVFITLITTLMLKPCIWPRVTVHIFVTVTIKAAREHILHLICQGEEHSESSAAFPANRWLHRCCLCQGESLSSRKLEQGGKSMVNSYNSFYYNPGDILGIS